ncbi:hypothetical protein [Robertmurraya andreesenii]|uniref:Uncharacterized protein n=1 Tax=Anoxybacillus andreesenii TaxID=1325932 RepID=A0ABT9V1U2_9BACL|nr:hypothetical protein [Robertmurraya andreesenii]MDQ0154908.1 hypothetical protein [Robertmurraya andreesenii]
MAFDLRAVLRLDGSQFTRALNSITRATQNANRQTDIWRDNQGRLRDSMGRFVRQTGNASNSVSRLGRAFTSPIRAVGSLTTGLNGLVGAYAAVTGAKKIFEETIGAAAKYEQSSITISAILDDKVLGKQYMDMVDRFAVDSPIMNSQDMLANSKSFLTSIGKDMKQLEKAWSLAERMAAIDPYQGVEGAVFALREMFSGDAISMVRRFEFPRKVMNEIKKLDVPDQLDALDKYFNKIGMTQKLIDDMGGTTLGLWAQIKEYVQVALRDIGMPALQRIRTVLKDIVGIQMSKDELDKWRQLLPKDDFEQTFAKQIRFENFKKTGAKILENIAQGFISAAKGIGKWIESIQNNPEFQAQTTLAGKVEWVIGDVYAKFLEWLDGGGREKIQNTASDLIEILIGAIEASIEVIVPVAVSVGSAIGKGIISGVKNSIESSWLAQLISDPVGYALKWVSGGKIDLPGHTKETKKKIKEKGKGKSFASGLSNVPYNGFQATLHKGERVLTPEENREYTKGMGGLQIAKLADTIIVREDADIDAIGDALVRKWQAAWEAGA